MMPLFYLNVGIISFLLTEHAYHMRNLSLNILIIGQNEGRTDPD